MDECAYHCGLDRSQHKPGLVSHPFTLERSERTPTATLRASALPSDAVLRQALIDRGIVTLKDLQRAEAKIKALQDLVGE